MPIDSSIPLDIKPIQQQNPLQTAGQVLSLRNMVNQGQMQEQEMQMRGMEIQQRAQDLQDQHLMRQAYMDANGDLEKTQQLAMQRGASPKAVQAINQMMMTTRTNVAKMKEAERTLADSQNDRLQGLYQPAVDAEGNPDKAKIAWSNAWQQANREGLQDPNKHPVPMDWPGAEAARMFMATLNTQSGALKEAGERATTATRQAELEKAQTANASRILSNQPNQEGMDSAFAALRSQGYPDSLLKQFRTDATPEGLKQNARMGMTPEQRTVADENEQKTETLKMGQIASRLANNPKSYESLRGELPQKYASQFPEHFTDRESILAIGATPAQQLTATHQANTEDMTSRRLDQGDRRLDIMQQNANRTQNRTDQSERNGDQRQIRKNQFDQSKLNQLRLQLGTALGGVTYDKDGNVTGGTFIDDKGTRHDIAALGRGDDNPTAAMNGAVEDMKTRYGAHTDTLKNNIAETNDLYQKWGAEPGVSTEKAHAALDAGDAKLYSDMEARKSGKPVPKGTTVPNTLAPGETPSPSGAPSTGTFVPRNQPGAAAAVASQAKSAKVATAAQVAAYAKQKGISVDAATQEAKKLGYSIQ